MQQVADGERASPDQLVQRIVDGERGVIGAGRGTLRRYRLARSDTGICRVQSADGRGEIDTGSTTGTASPDAAAASGLKLGTLAAAVDACDTTEILLEIVPSPRADPGCLPLSGEVHRDAHWIMADRPMASAQSGLAVEDVLNRG